MKTKVLVGLGNPGVEYEMTRHNIGYLVIKAFARQMGWHFKEEKRFNAFAAKGVIEQQAVHLLLPTTYMNRSGLAVRSYLDFFKLNPSAVIGVVDDIALPFGRLRVKPMGSSGGHNGLKSLEACLGTSHYVRLRMGIGHPGQKILADYVLEPFNQEELQHLVAFIDRAVTVLHNLVKEDVGQVMNKVNAVD